MGSANGSRWRWTILLILFLVCFSLILVAAYTGRIPGWLARIPAYDKIGHALLMGLLGYLAHRALGRRMLRLGNVRLPLGPLLVALLVVAEELAQRGSPYRTFSLFDLAADAAGLLAVAPLDRLWLSRKESVHALDDPRGPTQRP